MMTLGFEDHNWDIHVKWTLGVPLFHKEWNWYVSDYKIVVGDTLVLERTDEPLKFKVCIFESSLLEPPNPSEGIY